MDAADDPEGRRFVDQLPPGVMTMVGAKRIQNVVDCVADVVANGVPGDLIETGVWRGGTSIVMRGTLNALGGGDRAVYVADSFAGLPPPDPDRYPADRGSDLHEYQELAVELEEVKRGFQRYGLLDDRVHFVKGFFRDTLPALQGHPWSLCRLDGDLYESTMDALTSLYPSLSPGGWIIVDDYFAVPGCQQAVTDYRDENDLSEPIVTIDWGGVCWKKGDLQGQPPPPLGILP
jgi:O-methyltransferase